MNENSDFDEIVAFYYGLTSCIACIITFVGWTLTFFMTTNPTAWDMLCYMASKGVILAPIVMGVYGFLCLRLKPQRKNTWQMGAIGIIGLLGFVLGLIAFTIMQQIGIGSLLYDMNQ